MNFARNLSIASLVACSLFVVSASADTGFPTGKYQAGHLTVNFGSDGRFQVIEDGKTVVEGTYQSDDAKLTITDVSGAYACPKDQASGTYGWRSEKSELTLKKIEDTCSDRSSDLDGHTLQRQ